MHFGLPVHAYELNFSSGGGGEDGSDVAARQDDRRGYFNETSGILSQNMIFS